MSIAPREAPEPGVSDERLLSWLRLVAVPMFGPVLIRRAVEALGSPEAVLQADAVRLAMVEGIGPQRAESFACAVAGTLEQARRDLDEARMRHIQILCRDHAGWPPGLRNIHDPPVVLYVRGRLAARDAVAIGIVGSRKCSLYGREQAERFGALLAGAGMTVISGGARGIDTGAHLGALRAKGRTVVVQGCGMGHCYPPENVDLYQRIVDEDAGAIISELPLHVAPSSENFPPRNRIIAGMSLGVLVVEANERSGSLITARLAADDYGREVFALPGRVDSACSAGTHQLIKKGMAYLVENLGDILEGLGDVGRALKEPGTAAPERAKRPSASSAGGSEQEIGLFEAPAPAFTHAQRQIMEALRQDGGHGCSVDDLCEQTHLPAAVVMAELTMLQIRGLVHRTADHRFARKAIISA